MTWNLRVMRYADGTLGVHEVYYAGKKVTGWTESPTAVAGETVEELRSYLKMVKRALDAPILDYAAVLPK